MDNDAQLRSRIVTFERTLATQPQAQLKEFFPLANLILAQRTPQQSIRGALADAFSAQALLRVDHCVLDVTKPDRNKHALLGTLAKICSSARYPAAVRPHTLIAVFGSSLPSRRFLEIVESLCRTFGIDDTYAALVQARAAGGADPAGWKYGDARDAEAALNASNKASVGEEEEALGVTQSEPTSPQPSVEARSVASPEGPRRHEGEFGHDVLEDDSLMQPLASLARNPEPDRQDHHERVEQVEQNDFSPCLILQDDILQDDTFDEDDDSNEHADEVSTDATTFAIENGNNLAVPISPPTSGHGHQVDGQSTGQNSNCNISSADNTVNAPRALLSANVSLTRRTAHERNRLSSIREEEEPEVANMQHKRRKLDRSCTPTMSMSVAKHQIESTKRFTDIVNIPKAAQKTSAGETSVMTRTSTASTTTPATTPPTSFARPETSLVYAIHSCTRGEWMSSTAIFEILTAFNPNPDRVLVVESGFIDLNCPAAASLVVRVRNFGPTHTTLVVPLYVPHHHWNVAIFQFDLHTVVLYDPLRAERVSLESRQVVEHFLSSDFVKSRTEDGSTWEIEDNEASLRQANKLDCGVYAIIIALFAAADAEPPPQAHPTLWRRAFRECLKSLSSSVLGEESTFWDDCWKEVQGSVPAFQPRAIHSYEELADFYKSAINDRRRSLQQQSERAKALARECSSIQELAKTPVTHTESLLEGLRYLICRERMLLQRIIPEAHEQSAEFPFLEAHPMPDIDGFRTLKAMKATMNLMERGEKFFMQAAERIHDEMQKLPCV